MSLVKDKIYGDEVEEDFKAYFQSKGYEVFESTKNQNMRGHLDFFVKKNGKTVKVEVKGKKRINKGDELSDEVTWIEFVGVTGYCGWLYGDADYLAFKREDGYSLVDRKILIEEVTQKVFMNRCKWGKGLYELHDRSAYGKKDLMTLIPLKLIDKIGIKI